jgi:hypothetical protein
VLLMIGLLVWMRRVATTTTPNRVSAAVGS